MQFFTGSNLYYSLLSFNILVDKEITNISSFAEILKLQDLQYYDDFHIKYNFYYIDQKYNMSKICLQKFELECNSHT